MIFIYYDSLIDQTEGPFNFGCQNANNGNCCSASEPCKLLFWRRAAAAIVMASVFSVCGRDIFRSGDIVYEVVGG